MYHTAAGIGFDEKHVLEGNSVIKAVGNDAVDELISSANAAIKALQDANRYSRVSVILYSGNNNTSQNAAESDNTLSAKITVNGQRAESVSAEFVNTYHFVPKTGDSADTLVMAAVCSIGTAVLIAVAVFSKKKRRYFEQA